MTKFYEMSRVEMEKECEKVVREIQGVRAQVRGLIEATEWEAESQDRSMRDAVVELVMGMLTDMGRWEKVKEVVDRATDQWAVRNGY